MLKKIFNTKNKLYLLPIIIASVVLFLAVSCNNEKSNPEEATEQIRDGFDDAGGKLAPDQKN